MNIIIAPCGCSPHAWYTERAGEAYRVVPFHGQYVLHADAQDAKAIWHHVPLCCAKEEVAP